MNSRQAPRLPAPLFLFELFAIGIGQFVRRMKLIEDFPLDVGYRRRWCFPHERPDFKPLTQAETRAAERVFQELRDHLIDNPEGGLETSNTADHRSESRGQEGVATKSSVRTVVRATIQRSQADLEKMILEMDKKLNELLQRQNADLMLKYDDKSPSGMSKNSTGSHHTLSSRRSGGFFAGPLPE